MTASMPGSHGIPQGPRDASPAPRAVRWLSPPSDKAVYVSYALFSWSQDILVPGARAQSARPYVRVQPGDAVLRLALGEIASTFATLCSAFHIPHLIMDCSGRPQQG